MLKKCGLLFLVATIFSLSVAIRPINNVFVSNFTTQANNTNYRLPSDTKPVSYKIKLTPNIVVGAFTFKGEVEVEFNVEKATRSVTFHIDDITIDKDEIKIVDKIKPTVLLKVTKTTRDAVKHFFTIELQDQLTKGSSYILSLSYKGILNDELFGFYRSSYKNEEGEQVYVI